MDVLSRVLQTVRFSGAVLFRADLTAPWSVAAPPAAELAPVLPPGIEPGNVILFHIVTRGSCWITLPDNRNFKFDSGDVVVIRGGAHTLCDAPGGKPVYVTELLPRGASSAPPAFQYGGGGAETALCCGCFGFSAGGFNPLLAALPDVFYVRAKDDTAGEWLRGTLAYFLREAQTARPGGNALLARLSELLFIEVVRHHMQNLPAGAANWLSALRDPLVGKALDLLHCEPQHAWTVGHLAQRVGVSRSGLAARFSELLGEAPMRYLTRWRIRVASKLLQDHEDGIAGVAVRVGYESEAAFNRAFKRYMGQPPATWLRSQPAGMGRE